DRNVTGVDGFRAVQDVDIHRRRADVEKRHDQAGRRLVIDFVTVLKSEGVNVDDSGLFTCELYSLLDVGYLVALAGGHQNLKSLVRAACNLVVKRDIGDVERDVL